MDNCCEWCCVHEFMGEFECGGGVGDDVVDAGPTGSPTLERCSVVLDAPGVHIVVGES